MKSIRRRLTIAVLAALLAVLTAGSTAVYWAAREAHYDQFDANLRTKALVIITSTEVRNGRVRVDFADRFLREFDDDVATSFFQVWDDKGQRVERSDSLGDDELPRRYRTLDRPTYWNLTLPDRSAGRAIGIGFRARAEASRRDEAARDAVVVVAAKRGELDRMLDRLLLILLAAGAGALLVAAITVPTVMKLGLRPLDELVAWADGIDARRLTERIATDRLPRELRSIGTRLNELLGRLSVSFERERRFSSNLAHELLTPVAELRALAESALKWPDSQGPEAQRQSLAAALRMEGLITRLLELLRAEEGRLPLNAETVALDALVTESARRFESAAHARNLTTAIDIPPDLVATVDPVLMRSILHNLWANAVQYAPPASTVRVAAIRRPEAIELTVTNLAPNLRPEDLPNLFERLWRKDEVRSDGANHGLGLSLSREFAQLIGWNLSADLAENGELTMTLRGPAG